MQYLGKRILSNDCGIRQASDIWFHYPFYRVRDRSRGTSTGFALNCLNSPTNWSISPSWMMTRKCCSQLQITLKLLTWRLSWASPYILGSRGRRKLVLSVRMRFEVWRTIYDYKRTRVHSRAHNLLGRKAIFIRISHIDYWGSSRSPHYILQNHRWTRNGFNLLNNVPIKLLV